jgi:hypothetical protein
VIWKICLLTFALGLVPFPNARAAAVHSAEATHYLYKAIDAYDHEDFGAAKLSLQMALQQEPNFAEAVMLKGLLLYRDGKPEEANAAFKRALDLNPRLPERMREKLEQEAHAVESSLSQQEFSHFLLQFHGADQRGQAWDAVKFLDAAYNELGSRFGQFPAAKIPVIIFSAQEFWEAWNAPLWLGGFFDKRDGKVRVRMDDPPGGEAEMSRRLRHEFTHAFLHQLYSKDLPLWFQEGAAQFFAYADPVDSLWKEKRLEELRKITKGAPWLDVAKIQEVIAKKNVNPGIIYLAYLESEALCAFVAKQRGDSWIPQLVTRLREGASFEKAFLDVVGISPARAMEQLQKSWAY